MNATLASLQQRGDVFTRSMLNSKRRVSQLTDAIREADDLILKNRDRTKKKAIGLLNLHSLTPHEAYQRADGLNPTKLADINQKKLVANLESRLNKALIRHSEVVNENNGIKAKVRNKIGSRGGCVMCFPCVCVCVCCCFVLCCRAPFVDSCCSLVLRTPLVHTGGLRGRTHRLNNHTPSAGGWWVAAPRYGRAPLRSRFLLPRCCCHRAKQEC